MKKELCIILLAVVVVVTSCSSLSNVISATAVIAGSVGAIDSDVAAGISKSSEAIGKAAEEITPQQEYFIGRAVAATIASRYSMYIPEDTIYTYLNNILHILALNSQKPELYRGYSIAILDTDELNAFATSGGHVFISRGLITAVRSEDELASVIAHEIGHIQLSHSVKAIKNSRFSNALAVTAVSAASVAASSHGNEDLADLVSTFGESISEVVTTLLDSGYSKHQEFDADAAALSILHSSGYDPNALLSVLQILKDRNLGGGGLGATHPAPEERIKEVNKKLRELPRSYTDSADRQLRFNEIITAL